MVYGGVIRVLFERGHTAFVPEGAPQEYPLGAR